MRILFCSHTADLGGAEIMLETMVHGLLEHGFEPHVALPGDGPLRSRLGEAGISLHRLPFASVGHVRRATPAPGAARSLPGLSVVAMATRRLVVRIGARAVITNSQKAHVACSLGAAIAGVPVLWRLHDIVTPQTFGPAQRLALRTARTLSRARVIAVSRAAANAASRYLGARHVTVVYNGIDETRRRPRSRIDLRGQCGWPSGALIVGMLGRLVPWKGGRAFVEAARLITQSRPDVCFVMAGAPLLDAREGFEAQIGRRVRDWGLEDRFRIVPFQHDVQALLENYNVLAQPSLEPDPLPVSVIESLAAGVPVVGFDHGGISELIQDNVAGRLVPPGDVQGLAHACLDLLGDSRLRRRYSEAARLASLRFTAEAMCSRLATEINRVGLPAPPSARGPRARGQFRTHVERMRWPAS